MIIHYGIAPLLVVSASCNNIPVLALFNEEVAILLNDFVETVQITPPSNKEIDDLYAQEEDKDLQTVPNNREVYQAGARLRRQHRYE